jgi:hypothetical protein
MVSSRDQATRSEGGDRETTSEDVIKIFNVLQLATPIILAE